MTTPQKPSDNEHEKLASETIVDLAPSDGESDALRGGDAWDNKGKTPK